MSFLPYRTSELQDKIQAVQDDLQRVNASIDDHEGERSTKYRELRKKEQAFKGNITIYVIRGMATPGPVQSLLVPGL